MSRNWLALCIGNTHQHWAAFSGDQLQQTWEIAQAQLTPPHKAPSTDLTSHLTRLQECPAWPPILNLHTQTPPIWLNSVVPAQTTLWQAYPQLHQIQLSHIPLTHTYPSLGIDRALAVWAAGQKYGFPILVIDGGTGLTLSAAQAPAQFAGGAILPGIGLQQRSLWLQTAALPQISSSPDLPQRWAMDTETAIRSGILHVLLAGLRDFILDWWQQHPQSAVVFTGGDGAWLQTTLPHQYPQLDPALLKLEPHLQFWAIRELRQQLEKG